MMSMSMCLWKGLCEKIACVYGKVYVTVVQMIFRFDITKLSYIENVML